MDVSYTDQQANDPTCRVMDILNLRVVSRRFDSVALPTVYRNLRINAQLTARGARQAHPTAFRHIATYTVHIIADSTLGPRGLLRVLNQTKKLQTVT